MLPNHSHYVGSDGLLHIVGEVLNNTTAYIASVTIAVSLFSSGGHEVETELGFTWLDNLPSGEKTCFDAALSQTTGWAYYEFAQPSFSQGRPLPNLTILNAAGSILPYMGWYQLTGQVRNEQGTRVDYIACVGTLYNAEGKVVGCDFSPIGSLQHTETRSFTILFAGRNYSDVASYRVQADGEPE